MQKGVARDERARKMNKRMDRKGENGD